MAARGQKKKTVDPKTVKDSFEWADAYKQGYKNVVLQDNGDLTIMKTTKELDVAKTIPHLLGHDSTVVLAQEGEEDNEELRALAEKTQQTLYEKIEEKSVARTKQYLITERALLESIEKWQLEKEVSVRRNLAFQIGRLTSLMQQRDEQVQQAKYSNRHWREEEVPKVLINYASKANGNTVISRLVNQATSVEDRTFTVKDKA